MKVSLSDLRFELWCSAHIGDTANLVCKISLDEEQFLVAPVVMKSQVIQFTALPSSTLANCNHYLHKGSLPQTLTQPPFHQRSNLLKSCTLPSANHPEEEYLCCLKLANPYSPMTSRLNDIVFAGNLGCGLCGPPGHSHRRGLYNKCFGMSWSWLYHKARLYSHGCASQSYYKGCARFLFRRNSIGLENKTSSSCVSHPPSFNVPHWSQSRCFSLVQRSLHTEQYIEWELGEQNSNIGKHSHAYFLLHSSYIGIGSEISCPWKARAYRGNQKILVSEYDP